MVVFFADRSLGGRLVVQALKAFGEDHISPSLVSIIREKFPSQVRQRMLADTRTATGWIYAVIRDIAGGVSNG